MNFQINISTLKTMSISKIQERCKRDKNSHLEILHILFKNDEYFLISKLFEKFQDDLDSTVQLNIYWKSLLEVGQVSESWKVFLKLLKKNELRKKYQIIQSLIFQAKEIYGNKPELYLANLKVFIHLGNIEEIDSLCSEISKNKNVLNFFFRAEGFINLMQTITHYKWVLSNSEKLSELIINNFDSSEVYPSNVQLLLFEMMYDSLIFNSSTVNLTLKKLLCFSISIGKKKLPQIILKIARDNLGLTGDELKRIEDEIENAKEEELESYDLGIDLFNENRQGQGILQQIRKLEKNIKYLEKIGDKENLNLMISELSTLDANHMLVSKYNYIKSLGKETYNINEIESSLNSYIDEVSNLFNVENAEDSSLKDAITLLVIKSSASDMNEIEDDYITALMLMKKYEEVLFFLDKLDEKFKDLRYRKKDERNLSRGYYRALSLIELNQPYKAIDVINYLLKNYPLNDNELMSLYYMKGQSLFNLNRLEEARTIFAYVHSKFPNYGNVKFKMKNCEKT